MKLKPIELRNRVPTEKELAKIKKNPIYIIIDNVLDTYNIGAIFRLADAVAAERVILCGETETPPNTKIKRASINTTEWVEWEYFESAAEAIKNLRKQFSTPLEQYFDDTGHKYSSSEEKPNREASGIQIVAIEQSSKSVPYDKFNYRFPIAFVLGHETRGVSKEALAVSDAIVELPMHGINTSLNVMVSLAIILYRAMEECRRS